MKELTKGQGVWKRQPSTGDFTNFHMHSLTLVAKVWYNFLCVKIKPTLHLSTVTKEKTILLYTMTRGFQFDIGSVIERGLIELTQGRCTRALIHPSLITQLCQLAEVPNFGLRGAIAAMPTHTTAQGEVREPWRFERGSRLRCSSS